MTTYANRITIWATTTFIATINHEIWNVRVRAIPFNPYIVRVYLSDFYFSDTRFHVIMQICRIQYGFLADGTGVGVATHWPHLSWNFTHAEHITNHSPPCWWIATLPKPRYFSRWGFFSPFSLQVLQTNEPATKTFAILRGDLIWIARWLKHFAFGFPVSQKSSWVKL